MLRSGASAGTGDYLESWLDTMAGTPPLQAQLVTADLVSAQADRR
jgi:hypothetical protein